MMERSLPICTSLLAGLLIGAAPARGLPAAEPAAPEEPAAVAPTARDDGPALEFEPASAEKLFALRIQPLLAAKCIACHGEDPDAIEGGLDLTTREGLLAGGETSEEVVRPGKPSESLLLQAVRWEGGLEMPPKENDRLSDAQIAALAEWIEAGAPWPSDDRMAAIQREHSAEPSSGISVSGILVRTEGALSEAWANRFYKPGDLWAYQPIRSPTLELDVSGGPSANPIDAFINRRLEQLELQPAPRADRRTLIRRANFDLTGLPPTPEEIAWFVDDPAPDREAFAALVERLLASPHYGEQWGRHWLDVARYADSSGLANDFERPNAWRYRDYVVRSFNADKPYDQFIREQLAGDEIDADDPEMLIAVGFLRMGPWEHTGMSVGKLTRQQFLDDVTDSVGQALLSHPLQCASCHDHKFDPIPTQDYYRIQAVFATTQFADRDAEFLETENRRGAEQEAGYLQQRIEHYRGVLQEINEKHERAARQWYAERGGEYAPRQRLIRQGIPEDEIAPRHLGLSAEDMGLERIARKNLTRFQWELDRFQPLAMSVYSGTTRPFRPVTSRIEMPEQPELGGTLEATAILAGGDPFSPSTPVTPGVLSALSAGNFSEEGRRTGEIPETVAGRRLAFAQWVTDPNNPLASRSIVNRIWQGHFGQAIAGNPNNFGATGKKPTHPGLLDYLAQQLIDSGWSIKAMHRRIMNSDTYCRSAHHPAITDLLQRDPERTSYAAFPPRRLAAEELRDAMLAASGELNPELGGIPVRPNINLEAALQPRQIMGTYAPAWQPSPRPEQRNRRSLYALRLRGLTHPSLEVFNQPVSDESCERRETSTITPQVFSLFNSQDSYARALAMAYRVLQETDSPSAAVDRAFRLALARPPDAQELAECLEHWQKMTVRHRQIAFDPPDFPQQIRREAVEEMSGETFAFVEPLEIYADYQSDLHPSEVEPRLRGLAEVCLVLFNSNEFIYVY